MKLHYSPASTTSLSIVLFCAESRIPFEPIVVNLMTGEQKSPAHLKRDRDGLLRPSDSQARAPYIRLQADAAPFRQEPTKAGRAARPPEKVCRTALAFSCGL